MENQQPQTLNQTENSEMYPTVRLCWEIFLKTWKWFVLSVVLSLVIAYLYSNSRTRIYQRQSVMLIEDSEGSGGGMGTSRSRRGAANAVMELNGISVGDNFKNELFIISSQRLMERVVDSLRAVFISPYEGVVPPSGMPAHSSTLSAPPSCAARQLSTPLAHTSNSKSSLLIARSC